MNTLNVDLGQRFSFVRYFLSSLLLFLAIIIALHEHYVIRQKENFTFLFQSRDSSLSSIGSDIYKTLKSGEEIVVSLQKGATLETVLLKNGVAAKDVQDFTQQLKKIINVKNLQINQQIAIQFSDKSKLNLFRLSVDLFDKYRVIVLRNSDGKCYVKKEPFNFVTTIQKLSEKVGSKNLYNSIRESNLPKEVIRQVFIAFPHINPQSLKTVQFVEIVYEQRTISGGSFVKSGKLRYIGLLSGQQAFNFYHFSADGQHYCYYNSKGENICKPPLLMPIDLKKTRITSFFSNSRFHPIKRYWCAHKGIDLGAAKGTAVHAAGDGVVVRSGYIGNYGNCVHIKHNGGYETIYAHLSKIAQIGSFVRRGQVIGYVGSTGLATAPHLHFELIRNKTHINPLSIKHLAPTQLQGKSLDQFYKFKKETDKHIDMKRL
ncbi:MAG: M23 family metallopeptidase [Alphaproteobacteria bacterium]